MLFFGDSTPFDEHSWAVTIEYEEDGTVSDENADEIDYREFLARMKEDTATASNDRVEQGCESIKLLGCAAEPFYDEAEKKLPWAKELRFDGEDENTLNYNIRVLGRKGVLVLNFIAGMDQKALIDSQLASVRAIAEFDQGSRYEDFDPDLDEVVAYGLGALNAGCVKRTAATRMRRRDASSWLSPCPWMARDTREPTSPF